MYTYVCYLFTCIRGTLGKCFFQLEKKMPSTDNNLTKYNITYIYIVLNFEKN